MQTQHGTRGVPAAPQTTLSRDAYDAVLFGLDGVVTRTRPLHAAAWKRLFDDYLRERGEREGASHEPFDEERDYREHVLDHGRYDAVRLFLASRGIELQAGNPTDSPTEETVCGIGNRRTRYLVEELQRHGVERYESSVKLLDALRRHGFRVGIVTASKTCHHLLDAAELRHLVDTDVDGHDVERLELAGRPQPDMYLEAAQRLGVEPRRAVVVDDVASGVEAAHRAGFGLVIGVDRNGHGHGRALRRKGAVVVVGDLGELDVEDG